MAELIDREKLIDEIFKVSMTALFTDGIHCSARIALGTLEAIKNAPVVEPKNGKWTPILKESLMYRCSECGHESDHPYEYCPACGAKMSKGFDAAD